MTRTSSAISCSGCRLAILFVAVYDTEAPRPLTAAEIVHFCEFGWIRQFNITFVLVRPNRKAWTMVMVRMALVTGTNFHLIW